MKYKFQGRASLTRERFGNVGFSFLHGSIWQHRTEQIHCWMWGVVSGSPQVDDLQGVMSGEQTLIQ